MYMFALKQQIKTFTTYTHKYTNDKHNFHYEHSINLLKIKNFLETDN